MADTLNILKKISTTTDKAITEVALAYEKVKSALKEYVKQGGLKTLDIAVARADIERILLESGAYEVVRQDTRYQKYINDAMSMYKGLKFKSPQITAQELDAIRKADFVNFLSLTEQNRNDIARSVFQIRSGAIDYGTAVDIVAKAVDTTLGKAKTFTETAQTAFARISNEKLAESAGIERFQYVGPDDNITRDFCAEHIGEIGTLEEWDSLDNGQAGAGPVSQSCGGFNCRHMLIGVVDATESTIS